MLRSARLKAHLSTTTFLLESSGDIGWAVFCKLPNYLGVPSAQPLSSYRSFSSMSISLFRIDSMKILWKSHQSSMHIYDIIYTNKKYIFIYIYDIYMYKISNDFPVFWKTSCHMRQEKNPGSFGNMLSPKKSCWFGSGKTNPTSFLSSSLFRHGPWPVGLFENPVVRSRKRGGQAVQHLGGEGWWEVQVHELWKIVWDCTMLSKWF